MGDLTAMREERDRSVAFAFAAADLLVQLDCEWRVRFASGAAQTLLGTAAPALPGRDFREFVDLADQAYFERLLSMLVTRGRIDAVTLQLRRTDGRLLRVTLGGCCFGGKAPDFYLSLTKHNNVVGTDDRDRDPQTRLLSPESFTAAAARIARASHDPAGNQMVMLHVDGLTRLEDGLSDPARLQLRSEIAGLLRSASSGGDVAAQLDRETFSVVQTKGADAAELRFGLEAVAHASDPSVPVSVMSATLILDAAALGDQDAGQALAYCIKHFAKTKGAGFTMSSLSDGFCDMVNQTMARVTLVRSTLMEGKFTLVYQPIVDLSDGTLHHFEVLTRFAPGQSPFELVAFSEEIGLAEELDLAICETALRAARRAQIRHVLALNLSGRSIQSSSFITRLMALVTELAPDQRKIMFEITESAAIQSLDEVEGVIRLLRRRGHPLCLDDFGSGFSAFTYLRHFEVDYVKLDGKFLNAAYTRPRDAALVKSVTRLCQDLHCATIGEMIENQYEAKAAQTLGVNFGQGYYFGKPAAVPKYELR
jgi:EAL domain-containing protein (putative c-di-GMP-specific phosphodiesterase class I)/GGDEF domain-containing protein